MHLVLLPPHESGLFQGGSHCKDGGAGALRAPHAGPLRGLGGVGDWPERAVGAACAACLRVTCGVRPCSCMFEPEGNACSLTDSTAEEHVLALAEHAADEARDRVSRLLPGGKVAFCQDGGAAVGVSRCASGCRECLVSPLAGLAEPLALEGPAQEHVLWSGSGPRPHRDCSLLARLLGVRGSSGGRHQIRGVSTEADPARLLCRSLTLFSVDSRFHAPPQALVSLTRHGW